MMKNIVNLPDDMVVEILSRVPTVSLARLRSACKGWDALVKNDKFSKIHSANAPRQSLVILLINSRVYLVTVDLRGIHESVAPSVKLTYQFSLKDPVSNDPEQQVDINNVFHCDGLLLCTTKDKRLVVWNPCSGETSWIQTRDSNSKFVYYALDKSFSNKYKILRMEQHGNGYVGECLVEYEIYDFTSNSWRDVGKTRDWAIVGLMSRGTYVNGITYWLANSYRGVKGIFLLSFDFSTERFARVSLPGDSLSHLFQALSVTREEQKLCLLAQRLGHGYAPYDVDVWVGTKIDQSTGAISWSKFLIVERDIYKSHFMFINGMNFFLDLENKVLVCRGKHENSNRFLHIMGEDKYIEVDDHEAGSKCSLLVSYVPTLVQVQQASLG